MRFLCCFVALFLIIGVQAQETNGIHQDQGSDLSAVIATIMGNEGIKTPNKIKLNVNNKNVYANYDSHTEEALVVKFRGNNLTYPWDEFNTEEMLKIIDRFGLKGDDYLILAQFSMKENLPKLAKRYCGIAERKNPELSPKVKDMLKEIKAYEDDRKRSRYNHDGRKLPNLPKFDKVVAFDTPEADAIMSSMQFFPKDNPWNEDISKHPVHPDSDNILKFIGLDHNIRYDVSMNFTIVPPKQAKLLVKNVAHRGPFDSVPAPVPDNVAIEGWNGDPKSLDAYQRATGGDRHALIVDPWNNMLYEFFATRKTNDGWQAASFTYWRLDKNEVLPNRQTSADAAGLSVLAGIIRYDELQRGKVEHAIRVTFRQTRQEFIYPASHYASRTDNPHAPAMGQRFRLKKNVDTSGLQKEALAVVYALQKYGAICADNGSPWYMSGVKDPRVNMRIMHTLHRFKTSDFEVIQTTPGPK